MHSNKIIFGVKLLLIALLVFGSNLYAQTKSPNIIVILTDDQGWGATSVSIDNTIEESSSDFIRTPNLESFAEGGTIFSNAYASHPNCSPTRASLLTGKSPAQLRFTDIVGRDTGPLYEGNFLIPPMHISQLPDEEVTIAEWIKQHKPEYRAAHFGKWHVGREGPTFHGFDAGDGPTANDEGRESIHDNPKRMVGITDRGNEWMEAQVSEGNPFYLQISHYAVHLSMEYHPETLEEVSTWPKGKRHQHERFAAMTKDLDTSIGRLLNKVQELGIEDNTYIIFTSDNGTYPTENPTNINGPLHGWKATLWDGGIRVPFIVNGPGIGTGQIDQPVISYDIFPTICDWLNIEELPDDRLEGGSIVPLLDTGGKTKVKRSRDFIVFHWPHYQLQKGSHPVSAIRDGNYKLLKFYETGDLHLYDLEQDYSESRNIAQVKPEVTKELHRKLKRYLNEVGAGLPVVNLNYDPEKNPGKSHIDIKEKLMNNTYFVIE